MVTKLPEVTCEVTRKQCLAHYEIQRKARESTRPIRVVWRKPEYKCRHCGAVHPAKQMYERPAGQFYQHYCEKCVKSIAWRSKKPTKVKR